ncbi:MAG: hypothetical protein J7494_14390 [Sphingobium sp.]|nr:hypothetical protein [Sphingobium sp.]
MKRIGWPMGLALLALAACKAQPDAAPGNDTSRHATSKPAERISSKDQALARQLAGDWVTSEVRPTGSAEDNCATDAGISLGDDGSYGSLDEAGRWTVKGGVLLVTVTSRLDDSNEESNEAKEMPINPPRVDKWPIEKIEGDIAVMRFEDGQFWMFRCPPLPKA